MTQGQKRMHGAVLAVVLVSGVAMVGEASLVSSLAPTFSSVRAFGEVGVAPASDINARMKFVLDEVTRFESRERPRRRIRNGALCSDSYGSLMMVGSNRDRRAFLLRHLGVNENGWFFRAATTRGPTTTQTSTPGLCTILVMDIRWRTDIQTVGGVKIIHVRGNKKNRSSYLPAGCDQFYDSVSPAALYVDGLLNHLNRAWSNRSRRVARRSGPPPKERTVAAGAMTTSASPPPFTLAPRYAAHWPSNCIVQ